VPHVSPRTTECPEHKRPITAAGVCAVCGWSPADRSGTRLDTLMLTILAGLLAGAIVQASGYVATLWMFVYYVFLLAVGIIGWIRSAR